MKEVIENIVREKGRAKEALIPILQAIQNEFNYLPEEAMKYLCAITDIRAADISGVAGFYSQFRFTPAGKHRVKVCTGTACHVKGAEHVYDSFKRNLKIAPGKDTDESRTYTIEKVSCLGCCTLAPVVQVDETTYGHVASSDAKSVIDDFHSKGKKLPARDSSINGRYRYQGEIRIGLGSCCIASGSDDVRKAVEDVVIKNKLNVNLKHVGCIGMCHQVPLVEIIPENGVPHTYAKLLPEDAARVIEKHFSPPNLLTRFARSFENFIRGIQDDSSWEGVERYSVDVREKQVQAFLGDQVPIATEHRGILDPVDIDEYISLGGFEGLKKALEMKPADVIEEILKSGLKGRGGAGFPTGEKWHAVYDQESDEKFLICNGDEGDPGAFMDRMLLESYPYRIIEGMLIAAHATGATRGFFYIRAEYPLAVVRIREALDRCREKGIPGSKFSFDISVKEGAGAFVCGEESALIASMEGERGFPRIRPPYPAESGLWGKPTLINNTETFAQVPYILYHGQRSFSSIGSAGSKGSKVFALAGKINRGGLIEVPMGISIRQIVEDIGGGVQGGKKLKAVQVGGPSGGCVPHFLADKEVDFESLGEAGAMMGSGGLVVLDETDCMVDIARYFLSFTQHESCGKCTFCRAGTRRMLDIMEMLTQGRASEKQLEELQELGHWISRGSLCGLGKTAPNPVLSTLRYFREEYLAHINGRCPAGKCDALIRYSVGDECIGCTICAQECPDDAIEFRPHRKHEIDQELCSKCDICREACPEGAISIS